MAQLETDLAIIGAGPTGLYAAYYAGFRGLRVAVVDSLPELGGQITAMYPEKQILDVAGFPSIKGRDLVEGLVEQANTAEPEYLLDRTAVGLAHTDDDVTVTLDDGSEVRAKALLITAGIGKFSPRPLPAGEGWLGRGMEFFVPSFAPYAGKDVVIVGGGDSAFDWAIHLEPVARSITLVHRRDAFRAHERTVQAVRDSERRDRDQGPGDRAVRRADRRRGRDHRRRSGARYAVPAQAVVAALGFIADLGPLQHWGIEVEKRHVVVDAAMRTNLARVFAAGDITEYPGKVRLIAVGFGEAATAVNNAAVVIDPTRPRLPRPLQRRHLTPTPDRGTRARTARLGSAYRSVASRADRPGRKAEPVRVALLSYRSKPHCGGQGVYVRHLSRELVAPRVTRSRCSPGSPTPSSTRASG